LDVFVFHIWTPLLWTVFQAAVGAAGNTVRLSEDKLACAGEQWIVEICIGSV
jgi:hypothetical protein